MSQVIGQSSEPSQPGILGQNSANGDAVFGDGGSGGRGVVGVSQTHTGVEGTTVSGMAVFGGGGASGRGVVGLADAATAVEGQSKSGAGVWGQSQTGIGVLGKGGRLAGQFLGDVDITGNLIIQGVSIQAWLQRIVALEREVATRLAFGRWWDNADPVKQADHQQCHQPGIGQVSNQRERLSQEPRRTYPRDQHRDLGWRLFPGDLRRLG